MEAVGLGGVAGDSVEEGGGVSQVELVYQSEVVGEDGSWYEAAVSAYQQADEEVADAKWRRCRVAYGMMLRATESGDRSLMRKFAGDVRRTASHLRDEAFAHYLKVRLEGAGQPVPLTLTPSQPT